MKQRNFLIVTLSISILFFSCSKGDSGLAERNNATIHTAGATPITGNPQANYATRITIQNSAFTPSEVTVMVSGSILWINNDDVVHTVTADDGSFDSGDIQPGGSFGWTFTQIGPHPYHCRYHLEMTGLVKCVTK